MIGVPSRPNQLLDNIYQVSDNFSKIIGTHTIKFGGQYHFNQLEENLSNVANGNFFFGSNFACCASETGSDFVDFLLGAPSQFVQGQSYPSYGRSFYFGLYGQDSWRARPNLTLNLGLRYDVSSPWWEKFNEIQTIIPGEQSVVFPGSPTGWVFPGDPHVPRTLAPTRWNNFGPRLGLAYSFGDHDGAVGALLGKSGTSSLRAGYTLAYTSFEGATDFNEIGDAPFGDYTGPGEPSFSEPFIRRADGVNIGQPFPVAAPPKHVSASHPASGSPYDTLAEFYNAFGTIGSSPAFFNGNRLPYAENYELSFQRQFTPTDLLTLSYVGTQGHRLLSSKSANPGNPALCLATPGCGPGGENNIYINGSSAVLTTRSVLPGVELTPAQASAGLSGPVGTLLPDGNYGIVPFGNDSYFITSGKSSYNLASIPLWTDDFASLFQILHLEARPEIDPEFGDAQTQIASNLCQQGDYAAAIASYRLALKTHPNMSELLNNLAWLLATCPDASLRNGPEAVEIAEKACQLAHYKHAVMIRHFGSRLRGGGTI